MDVDVRGKEEVKREEGFFLILRLLRSEKRFAVLI